MKKHRDPLESFVVKHREEFDSQEPDQRVWSGISRELNEDKTIVLSPWRHMWKVAAVVLLGVCIYLLYDRSALLDQQPITQIEPHQNSKLEEVTVYYSSLIEEKKKELNTLTVNDQETMHQFQDELRSLSQSYKNLERELVETNNERVVDAMISNLQLQIEVLNHQIKILRKIKEYEDQDYII